MEQQNNNGTNENNNNLSAGENQELGTQNQNSDFNSQLQSKVLKNDGENILSGEKNTIPSNESSNTSNDISEKEKSFYKNELPSPDDEQIAEENIETDIDNSKKIDSEDVDEKSPRIMDKPVIEDEQVLENDLPSDTNWHENDDVNIISALNEKERNEDNERSEIVDEPNEIEKQNNLPSNSNQESDDVNIISALNEKERNEDEPKASI